MTALALSLSLELMLSQTFDGMGRNQFHGSLFKFGAVHPLELALFDRLAGKWPRLATTDRSPGVAGGVAVRQKARWLGGIALVGWDRLGWRGGLGERWMRMRDRRGPLAALLLLAGYGAALLWSQLWLAEALGAPVQARLDPTLIILLQINAWLLAWRIFMRACFTTAAYGWGQGLLSIPRMVVGNVIAVMAAARAISLHLGGGPLRWDKTSHIFPTELAR